MREVSSFTEQRPPHPPVSASVLLWWWRALQLNPQLTSQNVQTLQGIHHGGDVNVTIVLDESHPFKSAGSFVKDVTNMLGLGFKGVLQETFALDANVIFFQAENPIRYQNRDKICI